MGKSGGGGSSGSVQWPAYFQSWHEDILTAANTIASTAYAANPFITSIAFDPATYVASMLATPAALITKVDAAMLAGTDYHDAAVAANSAVTDHIYTAADLAAAEAAYNAIIDAEYVNSTLPKFQRGMQDINSVISSSFTTGAALIASEIVRKKAQFSADLRLQTEKDKANLISHAADIIVNHKQSLFAVSVQATQAQTEAYRIAIVARKEQVDANLKIAENDAKWNIDIISEFSHILAAGQGGIGASTPKASPLQSALGGMASAASIGIMAAMLIA
jgi:hypothetical protein